MFDSIIKPAIVLFLVCVIVTGALAGVNYITKDRIAEQQLIKATNARNAVLEANDFEFIGYGKEDTIIKEAYKGIDSNGNTIGYVITTLPKGYGGDIEVTTGINIELMVMGVEITSHNETPGLGANATNPDFKNQFDNVIADNGFTVVKSAKKSDTEIEALTGATITSKAVTEGVNEAIEVAKKIINGQMEFLEEGGGE